MQKVLFVTEGWARCGQCRNKLFRWTGNGKPHGIEIKCHSCRTINVCDKPQCGGCKFMVDGGCANQESVLFAQAVRECDGCREFIAKHKTYNRARKSRI